MATYNVTKAAVDELVRTCAAELGWFSIRVNGVLAVATETVTANHSREHGDHPRRYPRWQALAHTAAPGCQMTLPAPWCTSLPLLPAGSPGSCSVFAAGRRCRHRLATSTRRENAVPRRHGTRFGEVTLMPKTNDFELAADEIVAAAVDIFLEQASTRSACAASQHASGVTRAPFTAAL